MLFKFLMEVPQIELSVVHVYICFGGALCLNSCDLLLHQTYWRSFISAGLMPLLADWFRAKRSAQPSIHQSPTQPERARQRHSDKLHHYCSTATWSSHKNWMSKGEYRQRRPLSACSSHQQNVKWKHQRSKLCTLSCLIGFPSYSCAIKSLWLDVLSK